LLFFDFHGYDNGDQSLPVVIFEKMGPWLHWDAGKIGLVHHSITISKVNHREQADMTERLRSKYRGGSAPAYSWSLHSLPPLCSRLYQWRSSFFSESRIQLLLWTQNSFLNDQIDQRCKAQ
jgi:hypothetical protein